MLASRQDCYSVPFFEGSVSFVKGREKKRGEAKRELKNSEVV
jgi:hypothetical protein